MKDSRTSKRIDAYQVDTLLDAEKSLPYWLFKNCSIAQLILLQIFVISPCQLGGSLPLATMPSLHPYTQE